MKATKTRRQQVEASVPDVAGLRPTVDWTGVAFHPAGYVIVLRFTGYADELDAIEGLLSLVHEGALDPIDVQRASRSVQGLRVLRLEASPRYARSYHDDSPTAL